MRHLVQLAMCNAQSAIYIVVTLALSLSTATAEPLQWETAAGTWKEIEGQDGQIVLTGNGHAHPTEAGKHVLPRLRFTNVPDGPIAYQLETRANQCYMSTTFLLRGPVLGEGMVVMFHGNNAWRAFRNNLAPGHIEGDNFHPDRQTHHNFNTTLYDTKTVTATLYEDHPGLLDPEHPHSDKEEWWTIRVQLSNGRLMAKAWLSELEETSEWHLDFPVEVDETGPVGLEVNQPAHIRNMKIVPVTPPEHELVDLDHREARFGPTLPDNIVDVQVEEWSDEIHVRGELTDLAFDRQSCGIRRARMRQEVFLVECLPDLRITDASGQEFLQRHATDGNLRRLRDRGAWIELEGRCKPRTVDGAVFPTSFDFRYRIHRQSGLIHVAVTPQLPGRKSVDVRQLALVHELADTPGQAMNDCQFVSPSHFFGLGNRAIVHESREDGIVHASKLAVGTWGNGRYGFQVTPRSYALCSFDESIERDPHAYHHLSVGTRRGHRFLDMVFVNHAETTSPLRPGSVYESTFSLLPWRRYRPRVELKASSQVCGDPTVSCVDFEFEKLRAMAEQGITLHCAGYPPMGLLAPHVEQARVARQVRQAHYLGMKDMVAWVLGTNWIGSWGRYPNTTPFERGWLTEDEAYRARRVRPTPRGRQRKKDNARIPVEVCVNDSTTRRLFIDHITMPAMDRFKSSAVYWDWTWPIYFCDNKDHGDAPTSLTPLGHVALIDRFRRESARRDWRPTVMGCTYDAHCTPVSLLDMFNPGEAGKGWYVPNPAEHNLIYSSLLYGTQCIYHTYGGLALDTPRIYEQALAHCATVMFYDTPNDAPDSDPAGTPGGMNKFERDMWVRFMTPLTIFDVNRCEYRHPYDRDYYKFAATTDGCTAVLYYRNGQAMVVAVKDRENVPIGDITVDPGALGIAGNRILVFDVHSRSARIETLTDGRLELENVKLRDGPRFFVLQAVPEDPTTIWHSPNTWSAHVTRPSSEPHLEMRGVPGTRLKAYVWCGPAGKPSGITGGKLESFDAASTIATISSNADRHAHARVELRWD
jgi:hypothetical protein